MPSPPVSPSVFAACCVFCGHILHRILHCRQKRCLSKTVPAAWSYLLSDEHCLSEASLPAFNYRKLLVFQCLLSSSSSSRASAFVNFFPASTHNRLATCHKTLSRCLPFHGSLLIFKWQDKERSKIAAQPYHRFYALHLSYDPAVQTALSE